MRRHYIERLEADLNCIPGLNISVTFARTALYTLHAMVIAASMVACDAPASETRSDRSIPARIYRADYLVRPEVSNGGAHVQLTISQQQRLLRELSMPIDARMIRDIEGNGRVSINEGRVRWEPPAKGGTLSWFATIQHLRDDDTYDAYVGDAWALFRADDVIPPTATRTLKGSISRTRLRFDLPDDWSAVTEYFKRSNTFDISNPDRRFDRPTGWILLGELGVRHENIAGVRVVVAAPVNLGARRMDILALLNWTMPELVRLLPRFPKRLTIVTAGEPMWRGALSAPGSFFVHADRPLISENATSTIVHETLHIGLGASAERGADWIVEGLAEYYSLELLRRSGTITESRYRTSTTELANWGKQSRSLCADVSGAEVTARAVSVFARLNDEISNKSDRRYDLDDVVRRIAGAEEKISIRRLREIVGDLAGEASQVLSDKSLDNCEN